MNNQVNILIIAYASEPNTGSEYGVGWNVPKSLAMKYPDFNFYVITRGRCKDKIEKELKQANLPNLQFLFYDVPKWLYYKNELKSNWGEQINYIVWQLLVRFFIKKVHKKIKINIIHHLTFNQYRTPSPGFFLDIPFVMGPVGGAETINTSFYQDLQNHTLKKEILRRKGQDLKLFGFWCRRKKNKKIFIFSTKENVERLSPYCNGYPTKLLPAIAFDPKDFEYSEIDKSKNNSKFTLIYAGKALDWKGLHIFLKAASKAFVENRIYDFSIKLVGIRFKNEQDIVMKWVEEQGLSKYVELIPFIQRNELLKLLSCCSLSIYPAFRDSGSMSVLEASVLGCPTICFDTGGQDAFPDEILLKIPVTESYKANLNAFSQKLKWAYEHPIQIASIGIEAKKYVYEHFTWDKKAEYFQSIYHELI